MTTIYGVRFLFSKRFKVFTKSISQLQYFSVFRISTVFWLFLSTMSLRCHCIINEICTYTVFGTMKSIINKQWHFFFLLAVYALKINFSSFFVLWVFFGFGCSFCTDLDGKSFMFPMRKTEEHSFKLLFKWVWRIYDNSGTIYCIRLQFLRDEVIALYIITNNPEVFSGIFAFKLSVITSETGNERKKKTVLGFLFSFNIL